jgi:drug/metabolite transporter (DMT)-like permease
VIFRADLGAFLAFEVGRGELIYVVGCFSHAIYTPLIAKLNRGEPAILFTLGTLVAGAVLLTGYGAPAILATDWAALPPIVWITILYVAIAASAITFTLMQFASLRLPSAKVMAYTYLTPSWVILWEIALGRGLPPALIIVGVGLTALALLLLLKEEGPPSARRGGAPAGEPPSA